MQLFWTPASPFTRKVCIAAKETGQWDDIDVRPTTWPLEWGYRTVPFTPGLAEANPLARIPTLVTDDGDALGDSTLACLYLDQRAGGALTPGGGDVWRMWSLYGVADGLIEAQIAMRAEMLRPDLARSSAFLGKQGDRIGRCFDEIERRTQELGGKVDLAQITVGVACGYQLWRDWLEDWRPSHPRLARWYEAFAERPSMIETAPAETPER